MIEYEHNLDEILQMPFEAFRQPYSRPVSMEEYSVFRDAQKKEKKPVYPVTNELDYASFCKSNTMPQSGIHIGIAGGLQPFLYQSLKGNTQLSIACDISPRQIDLLEETLQMITQNDRDSFIELFAEKYHDDTYSPKAKIRNVWGLFGREEYDLLQKRAGEGRYKGIEGDFRNTGLPLAMRIAETTSIPISIIYLSSIRDFAEYQARKNPHELLRVIEAYKGMDRKIQYELERTDDEGREVEGPMRIRSDVMIIEYHTDWKNNPKKQKPRTLRRLLATSMKKPLEITPYKHIFVKG